MNITSQRGLSLLGVLVFGAIAAFVLIVGFRTVPVVTEYMAIKRIIAVLADEADMVTGFKEGKYEKAFVSSVYNRLSRPLFHVPVRDPLRADEGEKGPPLPEVRRSFNRRKQIDDVSSVGGADLVIDRSGSRTVIEVQYTRTVPLVANVSLLFDLHPSSAAR